MRTKVLWYTSKSLFDFWLQRCALNSATTAVTATAPDRSSAGLFIFLLGGYGAVPIGCIPISCFRWKNELHINPTELNTQDDNFSLSLSLLLLLEAFQIFIFSRITRNSSLKKICLSQYCFPKKSLFLTKIHDYWNYRNYHPRKNSQIVHTQTLETFI